MLRKWLINTVAFLILAYVLPGVVVDNWISAAIAALVLGILNTVIKPILIVLTIPISIVTLGIFLLVINAIMVKLADYFVDGFQVSSLFWAFVFSVGLSLIVGIFDGKKDS